MEVAPLNRYRKGKKSIVEVEVDGDDSITLKGTLFSLLLFPRIHTDVEGERGMSRFTSIISFQST